MTLTLAGRHPDLWRSAVDMFGPYDLMTFMQRIPETWKPYFALVLGDPENDEDHAFLVERSPKTAHREHLVPAARDPGQERSAGRGTGVA